MIVRVEHPRFGRRYECAGGNSVIVPIELHGGAVYGLRFDITAHDGASDEFVARLSDVQSIMPPITPEADALRNPQARLPMMDRYGFSANAEATQRRKEWAAKRIPA